MVVDIFLFIGAAGEDCLLMYVPSSTAYSIRDAGFSATRVWAVYDCNLWVFFLTLLLCLGNPAISLVSRNVWSIDLLHAVLTVKKVQLRYSTLA